MEEEKDESRHKRKFVDHQKMNMVYVDAFHIGTLNENFYVYAGAIRPLPPTGGSFIITKDKENEASEFTKAVNPEKLPFQTSLQTCLIIPIHRIKPLIKLFNDHLEQVEIQKQKRENKE